LIDFALIQKQRKTFDSPLANHFPQLRKALNAFFYSSSPLVKNTLFLDKLNDRGEKCL